MTPFGSEVEPDVYCRKARASDGALSISAAAAVVPLVSFKAMVASIHVISGHASEMLLDPDSLARPKERYFSAVSLRLASDTDDRYAAWEIATRALQLRAVCENALIYARTRRGSGGYTGTAIRPARRHATKLIIKSSEGRKTSSTRSPALSPALQANL
jgi:hypothetical protein